MGFVPRLLVVQPDQNQAETLRNALRAHIPDEIVIAESVEDALASIDRQLPDVILLPSLMSSVVEDYLIAYLSARPGAGHVQLLGMPRLERAPVVLPVQPPQKPVGLHEHFRSLLWWRRKQAAPREVLGVPRRDPDGFIQDVVDYLAAARDLKKELKELGEESAAMNPYSERRREPRFTSDEVPWISFVRMGDEQATLIDVSSRGALVRLQSRPDPRFLKRPETNQRQARLTMEVGYHREVHAAGRIIRCVPLASGGKTEYEIAFLFDDQVSLNERVVERLELTHLLTDASAIFVMPEAATGGRALGPSSERRDI